MPSLLDIAPPEIVSERVTIRGTEIEIRGIRNRGWAVLMRRFPVLRQQMAGTTIPDDELAVASMEVMPAVIAAGLVEKVAEEDIADRLTDAEQSELFAAIMRLTNPPAPLAESPAPEAGQAGNGAAATI